MSFAPRRLPLPRPVLLALALCVAAQATAEPPARSPYAGDTGRQIAALSDDQIEGLLEGRGLGLARAAELNGYPGPMHVLELAGELQLDAGQQEASEALMARMRAEARTLGAELVAAEAALDRDFAAGRIDAVSLRRQLETIGALSARLRGVHLAAHLEQKALLTPGQVAAYARLRGYDDPGHVAGHGHHGAH